MPVSTKFFVFKPVAVVATIVATALTILLPLLQGVAWVNENAVWAVWVAMLVLIVAAVLLHARLTAVQNMLTDARADVATERAAAEKARRMTDGEKLRADNAEARAVDAEKRVEALDASARLASDARLGGADRALADKLSDYASNSNVLNELAEFFSYMISRELVDAVREISELPRTRAAHNAALNNQLALLSESAEAWFRQFLQVAWTENDHYSTKLDPIASKSARKKHDEQTELLVELGFDLHSKLLGYQQYYASLEATPLG